MNMHKVSQCSINSKDGMLLGFEHYVALDWSKQTMAIAHMSPHPKVFERAAFRRATHSYPGNAIPSAQSNGKPQRGPSGTGLPRHAGRSPGSERACQVGQARVPQ
jgi:hypothetical protein